LKLIVIPLMVAMLVAALLVPFSNWLQRHRWPKWAAVAVSELGIIALVTGLVWLTVRTVMSGYPALVDQTLARWEEFKVFLLESPLHLSEGDINQWADDLVRAFQEDSSALVSGALSVGYGVGHFVTGLLLALFATLFIL